MRSSEAFPAALAVFTVFVLLVLNQSQSFCSKFSSSFILIFSSIHLSITLTGFLVPADDDGLSRPL